MDAIPATMAGIGISTAAIPANITASSSPPPPAYRTTITHEPSVGTKPVWTAAGPSWTTNQFNGDQVGYWQYGFYVEHVATGLWFLANYGEEFPQSSGPYKDRPDHWYLKAGLRERWTQLGHTVPYGFYDQRNDMFNSGP